MLREGKKTVFFRCSDWPFQSTLGHQWKEIFDPTFVANDEKRAEKCAAETPRPAADKRTSIRRRRWLRSANRRPSKWSAGPQWTPLCRVDVDHVSFVILHRPRVELMARRCPRLHFCCDAGDNGGKMAPREKNANNVRERKPTASAQSKDAVVVRRSRGGGGHSAPTSSSLADVPAPTPLFVA